ncbi:unnamed protein product [Heligmosomoides polygyrus]|uniref:Ion_trans domain-containing protein n=1 Tax=Heligmosomoides polygyrus TaxID=6339 RepID=A0A183FD89_HELPZ|nr:unnamed protein product [Heligmosomoides polygyrus]
MSHAGRKLLSEISQLTQHRLSGPSSVRSRVSIPPPPPPPPPPLPFVLVRSSPSAPGSACALLLAIDQVSLIVVEPMRHFSRRRRLLLLSFVDLIVTAEFLLRTSRVLGYIARNQPSLSL